MTKYTASPSLLLQPALPLADTAGRQRQGGGFNSVQGQGEPGVGLQTPWAETNIAPSLGYCPSLFTIAHPTCNSAHLT